MISICILNSFTIFAMLSYMYNVSGICLLFVIKD